MMVSVMMIRSNLLIAALVDRLVVAELVKTSPPAAGELPFRNCHQRNFKKIQLSNNLTSISRIFLLRACVQKLWSTGFNKIQLSNIKGWSSSWEEYSYSELVFVTISRTFLTSYNTCSSDLSSAILQSERDSHEKFLPSAVLKKLSSHDVKICGFGVMIIIWRSWNPECRHRYGKCGT